MGYIWNNLIKSPIGNSLIFFYGVFGGNLGLAIIALTLLVQLLLTPFRLPSLRTSKKLQELKPHLDKLKEKHKEDQTGLVKAQMKLYQEHGVNPLGGILPTLVSIPVIIALYQVLLGTLRNGTSLQTSFFWLNLAKPDPFFILPLTVGLTQYLVSRLITPNQSAPAKLVQESNQEKKENNLEDSMSTLQGQMRFIFPLFSIFIVASLPSGVGLYWLSSLVFSIIQQKWVMR